MYRTWNLDDMISTKAATLLHEVIHPVSHVFEDAFSEDLECDEIRDFRKRTEADPYSVSDLALRKVVLPSLRRDKLVCQRLQPFFRKPGRKYYYNAYGMRPCEVLAKLEDGAPAAVLNAESYVMLAGAVTAKYFSRRFPFVWKREQLQSMPLCRPLPADEGRR